MNSPKTLPISMHSEKSSLLCFHFTEARKLIESTGGAQIRKIGALPARKFFEDKVVSMKQFVCQNLRVQIRQNFWIVFSATGDTWYLGRVDDIIRQNICDNFSLTSAGIRDMHEGIVGIFWSHSVYRMGLKKFGRHVLDSTADSFWVIWATFKNMISDNQICSQICPKNYWTILAYLPILSVRV